jgi:hypothetical protein
MSNCLVRTVTIVKNITPLTTGEPCVPFVLFLVVVDCLNCLCALCISYEFLAFAVAIAECALNVHVIILY